MGAKRIFLIVLDSLGIGIAPDAPDYGDEGANTLKSVSRSPLFRADNLRKLGLFNIDGVDCAERSGSPSAAYAAMVERSAGKDTVTGHWEIAGIVSERAMPVYPDGFPREVIDEFTALTGRGVICNRPYSGTKVIADYGCEHIKTGKLIVYTSEDSVFQIAAHDSVVPLDELYSCCEKARKMLCGEHAVGRVIARPFTGEYPFVRTSDRHDYPLPPPGETLLDRLSAAGLDVIAVGKINDIFCGRGVTEKIKTSGNDDGLEKTSAVSKRSFHGLCFVNLVDFDMLYGHRNDTDGYAAAIARFDDWLGGFISSMDEHDVLMITADHGCDPCFPGTDHTRERVPLLIYGKTVSPGSLGTLKGFTHAGDIAARLLTVTR